MTISRLTANLPIVDPSGKPVPFFLTLINQELARTIEGSTTDYSALLTEVGDLQTTVAAQTAALSFRLRFDVAQALDATQQTQAQTNIGLGTKAVTWSALQTYSVAPTSIGYKVSGTTVVGARRTGWTADTGTADRAAHASYTAATISAAYVQAEVQALADALQNASRTIKALKDDLIAHGLIGT